MKVREREFTPQNSRK